MKRAIDLVLALLGLVTLTPLLATIGLLIWLTEGGPIFFRQQRVGRAGQQFRIWKFRTMVRDAPHQGRPLTVGDDPRITRIGRWLRKSKLDELPQLLNVLVGEMSLVGPRPEVQKYVKHYTPEQRRVLELKPGITDLASIEFCDENEVLAAAADAEREYIENVMPEKIRLNLEYAAQANVMTDLFVVFRTLARVWAPRRMRRVPDFGKNKQAA